MRSGAAIVRRSVEMESLIPMVGFPDYSADLPLPPAGKYKRLVGYPGSSICHFASRFFRLYTLGPNRRLMSLL